MLRARDTAPATALEIRGDGRTLELAGALTLRTLGSSGDALRARLARASATRLDLTRLIDLDTPGALLLARLRTRGVQLFGASGDHEALLELVESLPQKPWPQQLGVPRWREFLVEVGRGCHEARRDLLAIVAFAGRAAEATARALMRPQELRYPSISRQIRETGVHAIPIVALMAIMISIVIGYQGVAQLRPYGGEDFTVNLVAVSVLREMGVLITAIMVAGRSGSAFAAEIGVMKAREEIDALTVMGIEPMGVLVVPRLIGLAITLPLLVVFADAMGLLGGAAIARTLLDIAPLQYLQRVHKAVEASDLLVGFIKAPVFALVIGVIGCMHGLRVAGSAESVGRETTRAVVKAIFFVIILDALFSILFERLGL